MNELLFTVLVVLGFIVMAILPEVLWSLKMNSQLFIQNTNNSHIC
jgi:hypothetical protein